MGLFNLFNSPEQRKLQENINQIRKEIFPGGKQQQDQEVQEIRQLLNFNYSKEDTEYAYIYAVVSYHTSNNPKTNEIVEKVVRNYKCTVTREDAEKICLFIECKKYFKSTGSLVDTLKQKPDGDKLFMLAFGGIVEIKRAYKDLTNFGKFEVLLFNSLIALQQYQSNYPEKYDKMVPVFFKNIFNQAKVYNIPMTDNELIHFINSRFETYLQEIIRFFDEEEPGYLLLKIYTLFYEKPLELNPKTSFDLFEYAAFLPALMQMRKYIIEKAATTI
ncbi:MAG: hypothetical protein KA215_07325 [Flavobacterium sp.]|jgi:hypothetical protein|nr:hypothetical protein [Flavobacterium sp.]HQV37002.1 hypothetical protein [Flavobacterium sp.]HQX04557.1 hypothetical protein [Flavobacterium sp.]